LEQLSQPAGFTWKGNMNDSEYQQLLETAWRRELTPAQRARLLSLLAERPEASVDWESEEALTRVLRRLPEPALSSNFTALVLRAAASARGRPAETTTGGWPRWLQGLWPRVAWAAAALALGMASVQAYNMKSRTQLRHDLAAIPAVPRVPSPEILQDFDAIQQFSHVASAPSGIQTVSDEALLTALQ
jgi:hypothetical protein